MEETVTFCNPTSSPIKVRFDGRPGYPPVVDAEVQPGGTVEIPKKYVDSGALKALFPGLSDSEFAGIDKAVAPPVVARVKPLEEGAKFELHAEPKKKKGKK